MRRIITNYRNWALALALTAAILALLAVPAEDAPMAKWLLLLAGSKILAIACVMLACALYRRWNAEDKPQDLGNRRGGDGLQTNRQQETFNKLTRKP